jgi:hypothetical protein
MSWRIIPLLFGIVYLSNAQQATINNFKNNSVKCDYLIISPSEFSSQALTLANHRNDFDGDSVHFAKVAILEDILTQFHDTTSRAQILHNAIQWAYNNWSAVRLRYVVLIGDDSLSFDRSDSTWHSQGHMPAWIQNQYRNDRMPDCGSDLNYVAFDIDPSNGVLHDSLLKIAIGRIPCENSSQLKTYIDKVISFDNSISSGQWRNKVLAIADDCMQGSKPDAITHQISSDAILNSGFQNRFVKKLYLSGYTPNAVYEMPDARDDLIREINKNYLFTLFTGDGATDLLTDEHVLTAEYCDSVKNTIPGLFISLTVHGGAFFYPLQSSIAKKMLFKSQGGFIAVIGNPNLTYASENESFGRALVSSFSKSNNRSLGDLFNEVYIPNQSFDRSYLILGDPALIIKHDTLNLSVSKSNDLLTLQTKENDTVNYSFRITTSKHFTASSNGMDFDYDSTVYADSGKMFNSISKQLSFLNNTSYDISVYVWDKNSREGRLRIPVTNITTGIKINTKKQNAGSQFVFERQSLLIYSTLNRPQSFEFSLHDLQGRTVFNKSGLLNGNSVRISFTEKPYANRYYIYRLRIENQMFTGRVLIDKRLY